MGREVLIPAIANMRPRAGRGLNHELFVLLAARENRAGYAILAGEAPHRSHVWFGHFTIRLTKCLPALAAGIVVTEENPPGVRSPIELLRTPPNCHRVTVGYIARLRELYATFIFKLI